MKKNLSVFIYSMLLIASVITAGAYVSPAHARTRKPVSVTGTWQLVSYKYGSSQSTFTDVRDNIRRIKIISQDHFLWVEYDTLYRRITESAGGTCSMNGNLYSEKLEFGLGMDSYLKTSPSYQVKVEGDILFLSGMLRKGYKIEEIWKRIGN